MQGLYFKYIWSLLDEKFFDVKLICLDGVGYTSKCFIWLLAEDMMSLAGKLNHFQLIGAL